MFSNTLVLLALGASALANVYVTNPTINTVMTGGQPFTLTWIDDGKAPTLAQFGNGTVSIYTGNAQQQTQLQLIATGDVSQESSVTFTPDPTIGPDADEYFIRFESAALMEGTYPAMAFSSKFAMTGMTGTFNASVLSQIAGQSTAPISSPTSSAGSSGSAVVTTGAATTKIVTSTMASASHSASAAVPTKSSGASRTAVGAVGALAGFVAYAML